MRNNLKIYFLLVILPLFFIRGCNIPDKEEIILAECGLYIAPQDTISEYAIAVWLVKYFEKYRAIAYWDVNRPSGGFGTRVTKVGEFVSLEDANLNMRKEFDKRFDYISRKYPHLTVWQKRILSSTLYNVSGFGKNLEKAIATGDSKKIGKAILPYYHDANGESRDGLKKRRKLEQIALNLSPKERQVFGAWLQQEVQKQIQEELKRHKINL